MASLLRKPPFSRRVVGTGTGATNSNGGVIKIPLDMGMLVEEHIVNVDVSQTWGTNAPTGIDVRRFFSKVEVVSSQGTHISADFHQVYDVARFTEASSSETHSFGAGGGAAATASFSFDLHHVMDDAHVDLWSALRTADMSSLQLNITVAADASNGFTGGTGTVGVAAYTLAVEERALPGLSGKTKADRDALKFGAAHHVFRHLKEITGTNSVSRQSITLNTGNKTRFLFLHTWSVTGGALANGIIDEISLSVGGVDYYRNIKATALQQDNVKHRSFNQTGVIVIDRGEDPSQWIDLRDRNEVKLEITTLATAPASWRATCAQDYIEGMENFGH